MSNETINKKFDNFLISFNELLESGKQNTNSYFINFFEQEKKLTKYYRNNFYKNKINFNDAKKTLNLDLDFDKLAKYTPKPNNFDINCKRYKDSLISFISKIKTVSPSFICNNIFKRQWRSLQDLLDIIKIINASKSDSSIINKLFFKELYSILDRIVLEFCDLKSAENIKNITLEKIYADAYLEMFFSKFIKLKTNKNNLIIFKSYSEKNNEIVWENKKNPFFRNLDLNPLWRSIIDMRNDLEHAIPTFVYINSKETHSRLITSIELLIGFNFYLIFELNNLL